MIQGEVRYFKFKFPNKERPVLIITRNDAIPKLNVVTIAEITTTIRGNDSEVLLDESDGMFEDCAVNLTNIQTVQKDKIGSYITYLSPLKMAEVLQAIKFVFKID
jgi:mRNA interferase MazF